MFLKDFVKVFLHKKRKELKQLDTKTIHNQKRLIKGQVNQYENVIFVIFIECIVIGNTNVWCPFSLLLLCLLVYILLGCWLFINTYKAHINAFSTSLKGLVHPKKFCQ